MPDIAVMTLLRAESTVTTVATGKIRCGMLDEHDADRSIVIQRMTDTPLTHSKGADGTKFATLEILCIATDYGTAETIADTVCDVLADWTAGSGSADDAITAISLLGTNYEPGPPLPGRDKLREMFVVRCQVDYS